MTILDFLSPITRRPLQWFFTFFSTIIIIVTLSFILPSVQKHTIFFTVKPVAAAEKSFLNDGVESAEKISEMIAGWAKSPNFQQDIIRISNVEISGLKRKMAARKQNRLNVFWTLKLSGKDIVKSEKLISAIQDNLMTKIEEINTDSVIPIKITTPHVATEPLKIPLSWILLAAILGGFGIATIMAYFREAFSGKISFVEQITDIFPGSAILRVNTKAGKHDLRQINDFTETFESFRLVSTFPVAGKYFEIAPITTCTSEESTPILLVNLGETRLRELQNLEAIFGDGIGIIVFEK
jgi:hypothetical protein